MKTIAAVLAVSVAAFTVAGVASADEGRKDPMVTACPMAFELEWSYEECIGKGFTDLPDIQSALWRGELTAAMGDYWTLAGQVRVLAYRISAAGDATPEVLAALKTLQEGLQKAKVAIDAEVQKAADFSRLVPVPGGKGKVVELYSEDRMEMIKNFGEIFK